MEKEMEMPGIRISYFHERDRKSTYFLVNPQPLQKIDLTKEPWKYR